jgi:hypothetical protein
MVVNRTRTPGLACAAIAALAWARPGRAESARPGAVAGAHAIAKADAKVTGTPPAAATVVKDDSAASPPPRVGLLDRQHTVAEFEAGVMALPTAPISATQRGGATPFGTIGKGDATLLTGLHLLFRGAPDWAIGAGFLFAPQPTSDAELGGNLQRTHARSYLLVGAEARYFPFRYRFVEAWVGLAGSAVVIADRYAWTSAPAVPAILGSRTVTIATEGFALGIQAGGNWLFAERWVAGVTTRVSRWILPQTPTCSPVGDCATLSGTVEAFELGLTLGYRIPL